MPKSFKLVDTGHQLPSTSTKHLTVTNCKTCLICQEDTGEQLTRPSKSKRKSTGSVYSSLAKKLVEFSELEELPVDL